MNKVKIIFATILMFGGFVANALDTHILARAVDGAAADEVLGQYTDANGAKWRFGTVESNDVATIYQFAGTYTQSSCHGYTSVANSSTLPYLYANCTGNDVAIEGVTLGNRQLVMHPENVGVAHPCVAMELIVPKAAEYEIKLHVADGNSGGGTSNNDGILFCVYTNGVICNSWNVSGEAGNSTIDKKIRFNLDSTIPVTFVVNPNEKHSHDTTVISATITEYEGATIDWDDSIFGDYTSYVKDWKITSPDSFKAPQNGIYDIAAIVSDILYKNAAQDTDDIIRLYKNDVLQLVSYADTDESDVRFGVGLYLKKNDVIRFELNTDILAATPLFGARIIEVTKVKGEPLINLNDLYYDIISDPDATLPYTNKVAGLSNVVISAGINQNGGSWYHEYDDTYRFTSTRYSYSGNYTGFSHDNGFPWVLMNHQTTMAGPDTTFSKMPMMGKEILIHPDSGNDVYIKCTIPTNCFTKLVMIARDIMSGGADGVTAYATVDWNVETSGGYWSGGDYGGASLETGPYSRVVVSDSIDSRNGKTAACFGINRKSTYGCDSTAVQAYIFVADAIDSAKVISCDFDGKQPADAEPCTYAGDGFAKLVGSYWNSFRHVEFEDGETMFTHANLKNALGVATSISASFQSATTDNYGHWTIGFDNNGAGSDPTSTSALMGDYMYLYGQSVTMTLEGLSPNKVYDFYLFCSQSNGTSLKFGNVTKSVLGNDYKVVGSFPCALIFRALSPDEDGKLVGTLMGTASNPAVIGGFQLVDVTPEPTPLTIFLR